MTKRQTAGKTAKKKQGSITVTIDGERYRTLERIARAMNGIAWCDDDNTPESVFEAFVFTAAEQMLKDTRELCGFICDGISTGEDGMDAPEPLHSARIAELRAAFRPIVGDAEEA